MYMKMRPSTFRALSAREGEIREFKKVRVLLQQKRHLKNSTSL